MTTEDFNSVFRYRKGSIFGLWRDLSARETPQGDCQDYAWSVLCIEAGSPWKAILTGRAMIWRCQSPVNGLIPRHAVLWLRGKGWIDSTERHWRDRPAPHKLRWPAFSPVLAAVAVTAKLWGLW